MKTTDSRKNRIHIRYLAREARVQVFVGIVTTQRPEHCHIEGSVMEEQKLSFTLERETKNTIRYQEDASGKPPAIGTIYVQKWLLGDAPPRNLTVIISDSQDI